MASIQKLMDLFSEIPINIILWQMQNDYYSLINTTYHDYLAQARSGVEAAGIWLEAFRKLGEKFHFNLGAVLPEK